MHRISSPQAEASLRIAFGSDEDPSTARGVLAWLRQPGHQGQTVGALDGPRRSPPRRASWAQPRPWPRPRPQGAILFSWTGTGVCLAASKARNIRAALCHDAETAGGAQLRNDANVLCLSLRSTTPAVAEAILNAWFATRYPPNPQDDACLAALREIEAQNGLPDGAA